MNNQSKKKKVHKEDEHINLKVTGQDGNAVYFKIKKNTPLKKLMDAYCAFCTRTGIQTDGVRFRFDGNPINDGDTAAMLKMKDGDSIDAFGGLVQTVFLLAIYVCFLSWNGVVV